MAVVLSLLVGVGVGLTTSARLEMAGDGCDDGYLDCSDRAELCRADNYSQLLQMMTHCRQTCRKFFEEKVGSTNRDYWQIGITSVHTDCP